MPTRIVTIGGGHGQAALLASLVKLDCDITAVVSVADDGGCSGQLRRELGMPPPGDLRRCLTTLARRRDLAERFELRLFEPGAEGRSAGNLALSAAFREYGSLQRAVDWAAGLLDCRGRVVPVAESPGVLAVYDLVAGQVEGESRIEKESLAPLVAIVHGPTKTNPVAVEAIEAADFVFMGPGSFVGSILATLTTANVAEAIARSRAHRVLLANLRSENGLGDHREHVRMLRDHLTIASGGESVPFSTLCHVEGDDEQDALEDGTPRFGARLTLDGRVHDPTLVAGALVRHFGLSWREPAPPSVRPPPPHDVEEAFEQMVARAKRRLREPLDDRP